MLTPSTMLPFLSTPGDALQSTTGVHPLSPLTHRALEGLQTSFPGTLTPPHREALQVASGLDSTPIGHIDFTGQLYRDVGELSVFRPCIVLSVDSQGRQWLAETSRREGWPGPVWCVFSEPQVALYIAADLAEFLALLYRETCAGTSPAWLRRLNEAATHVWTHRGSLAFQSRQSMGNDEAVRRWSLQLPRDARIYDMRSPRMGIGWPYGAAGTAGRLHRCPGELLFAISGFPPPSRWAHYLSHLATSHETPMPAVVAHHRRAMASGQVSGGALCA